MEYKMIAMDFDGTLLNNNKKVSERNKKSLLKYKNLDYKIVGVTARNFPSVKSVCDLEMFDYLVMCNGCYLYDIKKQEGNYIKYLTPKIVEDITNHFYKTAKGLDYITIEKYYFYRKYGDINKRSFCVKIDDYNEVDSTILRLNIMADKKEDVVEYKKYIDENYHDVDSIFMQDTDNGKDDRWIALNPKGVNKFTTLRYLCENLGMSTNNVIFFGDSSNDIEAIQQVGLGVAMGNALPQVKEKAKEVTISNNEDGIAVFLEKRLFS